MYVKIFLYQNYEIKYQTITDHYPYLRPDHHPI